MWDGRGEEGGRCRRGEQEDRGREEFLWSKQMRETGPELHRDAVRRETKFTK